MAENEQQREYKRRWLAKQDPAELRAHRAAYAREWRARPENLERARASQRASRERAKAANPEEYLKRERERWHRHVAKPENLEKHRERNKRRYAAGATRRRGLTISDRHDYWVFRGGLCDFCGQPCPDPATPGAWKHTVIDHDASHCANQIGCSACVRAQCHRPCNVAEGQIRRAVEVGMIDGYTGRLAAVLADPPMQRWLASRTT